MYATPTGAPRPLSLVWLFLGSLVFYVAYLFQARANPILGAPLIDAFEYDQWAEAMAHGHWLWNRVGNYLPIYPAFLAILKIVSGGATALPLLAQGLMGAFGSVLAAWIAMAFWADRRVAWCAGLLHATNWMFVIHYAELYAETFSIFFLYVAVFLLVAKRGPAPAFFAGVCLALSVGARANLTILAPWIAVWLLGQGRADGAWGRALRQAVLFCAGMALVLAPIVARNFQLTGKPMLRAQGTWSLYSGIAPEINGLNPQPGVQFDNYMRMPLVAGLRSETDIEQFWAAKSHALLRGQPAAVFRVMLRKVLIFLTDREWSKEFDVYAHRAYAGILRPPWPGMGMLVSLGLAGCLFCRKKSDVVLVFGLLLLSIVSIFPFKVFGRYRMPCEALLIPFAGWCLGEMIRLARARDAKALACLAAPALVMALVSFPDWLHLKDQNAARHEHLVGEYVQYRGAPDEAVAWFQASMKKWPWDADSALRLAQIRFDQGRDVEAENYYREALRREPHFPEADAGLAQIYFHRGDLTNAQAMADACLGQYPNFVPAWQLKAFVARGQGNTSEEIRCYRRAIEEGGGAVVYFQFGRRLVAMNRFDEARELYGAMLESDAVAPDDKERARAALKEVSGVQ